MADTQTARLGFIGGGAMAGALAGGLIEAGAAPSHLLVAEPNPARRKELEESLHVSTTADNREAVAERDIVVIAVKPQQVPEALAGLREWPEAAKPLWISIAAGIPLTRLTALLPSGARIVRAMPNTPALVRAGATAICGNTHATKDDLASARLLFVAVGCVWEAPEEALLDAVTGLSGSGPAYVFVLLEALAEAGARVGLPQDAAQKLAAHTVFGAAKLALETRRPPAALREQVTSPGGTTLAGLGRLEAAGFRTAIYDAVAAATARAREIGRSS